MKNFGLIFNNKNTSGINLKLYCIYYFKENFLCWMSK